MVHAHVCLKLMSRILLSAEVTYLTFRSFVKFWAIGTGVASAHSCSQAYYIIINNILRSMAIQ
jgi:hypothetical protein